MTYEDAVKSGMDGIDIFAICSDLPFLLLQAPTRKLYN